MHPSAPGPSTLGWIVKLLGVVVAAVTAVVGGFWTATRTEGVRDDVCPHVDEWPFHRIFCGIEYDPVTTRDAGDFLVRYFGAATASGHAAAWDLMAPEMREAVYGEDSVKFAADSASTLWTEVMESPDRVGLNAFTVHLRSYYLDGRVEPYQVTVRVRSDYDGNVLLTRIGNRTRDPGAERGPYTWASITAAVDLHKLPRRDSPITLPAKYQLPENGRLRALFELAVPREGESPTASNAEWWTRTNQGWISNAQLTASGHRLGIRKCSPFILDH